MNNRQAGAFRELIHKEERAREKWNETFAHLAAQNGASTDRIPSQFAAAGSSITLDRPGSAYGASTLPLSNHTVYDQAIRISSPRLADEVDPLTGQNNTVTRKVVRQVEVPYTRQVKVPVKTVKIVPQVVQKKVKTKKLVEVPTYKEVDEEYTEVVKQPAIRQKEIWVKKIVPEKYMKQVEVKKTRKVKVPTTLLQEVDDYEVVNVTESRAVEVDGYRVDEVEDSKLVEVEEFQTYELRPHATGRAEVVNTREIGPIKGQQHHSRRVGAEVYHPNDERHREIETDSTPGTGRISSTLRQSGANIASARTSGRGPAASMRGAGAPSSGTGGPLSFNASSTLPNGAGQNTQNGASQHASIGFRVRDSDTNGVQVYKVAAGENAERAGVLVNDIVMYVNNKPTRNLDEFRSVLNSSTGPVLLQVRRRGVQKLLLTVHR